MCCQLSVSPLSREIADAMLVLGQFVMKGGMWVREIEEEHASVHVTYGGMSLELTLRPAISAYQHHFGKRITAGVYFEMASKYAEKVGGEMIQRANVQGCSIPGQSSLLLASYPSMPLQWERVCHGFQEVLLGVDHDAHADD